MITILLQNVTILMTYYWERGMEQDISYNKIKRVTNEELTEMWTRYFDDHENKELRDALILQYIYLTRYVVGRVKVALPPTFSYEDIDDAVTLASRR